MWESFSSIHEVFETFDELGGAENIEHLFYVEDAAYQLRNLSSVNSDELYITPLQCKFVHKWSVK